MTPEAKVKKVVVAQLKQLGAYYFYPVTGGYGQSGVPDVVGCYEGLFFGIECKAGNAGGIDLVVNEDNMNAVARLILGDN